ncbi:hypothetical protein Pmar_PMAR007552 [Perkinsus marinus ATCC 50983]|uniref:Phosphoglycolate phosphatase n=1 Tax=Perkinsus marinus (strain ATCC 50983 / TXsc) TaxID=423536 RepID=C5KIA0_PERM5|nr:hypothetical protein Pmar_PMAR007552 [Perkinsus marinus ATCC 50983]EER15793.1 hypothetical protein Pmar_PMAR007552 [Perkinsus marinus ATCC 50983]|eukprot:XP_002783997.1 hypothetical protein Pmar_PMAR007552 [Perkinsus marinus ATCC 50983]
MDVSAHQRVASTKRFIENEDIPLLAIDGIVGGDMKLRPKPSRDGVEFLLEKWQCRDPRQAMIVGDHPMDMEVGKGLGWRVGVYGTGLSTAESLVAAGATDLIIDVSKLIDCVIKRRSD